MFTARNHFAQLAAGSDARICARLHHPSRTGASATNEPLGKILAGSGAPVSRLFAGRAMAETTREFIAVTRQNRPSPALSELILSPEIIYSLGQQMSKCLCHAIRMKNSKSARFQVSLSAFVASCEIIAVFGMARLVKKTDGRHELIGGTRDDHAAAREWCSLFDHELVFSSVSWSATSRSFAA